MGVSGCGKSTIGERLAGVIIGAFIDADDLHPAANIAKMASGVPLTDEDRWPWLDRVANALAETNGPVVVACSALRRAYRDRLRAGAGRPLVLVHLDGSRELLAERMGARADHFMPSALLGSQLATLEPLEADEGGIVLDVRLPVAELVARAAAAVA
ncbi:MAG: gluconokinase [Microbacteriaceae bacterium]|nr:gluconokinase [Microbacteriaceae bacterium]